MLLALDESFLSKALERTSFNLTASDFQTLDHKLEIRHLISKYLLSIEYNPFCEFDIKDLNKTVSNLRTNRRFDSLFYYNLKGIGPGEILLYYLLDDAKLGGGSVSGDIVLPQVNFEVKAVDFSADGYMSNFKLGGMVPLHNIAEQIYNLVKEYDLKGSETEIPKSTVSVLRNRGLLTAIENLYRSTSHKHYFCKHDFMFMNSSKKNLGQIEYFGPVQQEFIFLERVSNGTIKPMIKTV
jgi:hypothetical protein